VTDEIATPTLARDLAEATAQLVAHDAYGVYHFTNSGECSHLEWAREILRLASNLDKLVKPHFKTKLSQTILTRISIFIDLVRQIPSFKRSLSMVFYQTPNEEGDERNGKRYLQKYLLLARRQGGSIEELGLLGVPKTNNVKETSNIDAGLVFGGRPPVHYQSNNGCWRTKATNRRVDFGGTPEMTDNIDLRLVQQRERTKKMRERLAKAEQREKRIAAEAELMKRLSEITQGIQKGVKEALNDLKLDVPEDGIMVIIHKAGDSGDFDVDVKIGKSKRNGNRKSIRTLGVSGYVLPDGSKVASASAVLDHFKHPHKGHFATRLIVDWAKDNPNKAETVEVIIGKDKVALTEAVNRI
jgi:hypothetical protein